MPPEVVTVTRKELVSRRRKVLASLRMTLPEWREFERTHTLTGDQWAAKEELDQIAFLLGEPAE